MSAPTIARLVDMNLPASLATALKEAGHPAAHVRERGLAAASDEEIVAHARARSETIVTNDLDFSRILAVEGATAPSVIILRLRDVKPARIATLLVGCLPTLMDPLCAGAIAIVEDAALRVRRLPVGGGS